MKQKRLTYPFVPKSVNWLRAGQFWALPLSDGTFGCARVIEVPPVESRRSRVEFLAGVIDWHSNVVPASDLIAGARCLMQARAHIRAITRTGGEILGFRDLSDDGIQPWLFRGAEGWINSFVYQGLAPVREQNARRRRTPGSLDMGLQFSSSHRGKTLCDGQGLTSRST